MIRALPPAEILDQIAANIDSPSDLKQLSLGSKQLHAVAARHTEYRIIRAPLLSPKLWLEFSFKKSFAQNVRTLEVFESLPRWDGDHIKTPVVPSDMRDKLEPQIPEDNAMVDIREDERAAELIFLAALANMSNLTSFHWNRTPPLVGPALEQDDVWTILAKHRSLTDLIVVDAPDYLYPTRNHIDNVEADDPRFHRLSRTKSFFQIAGLLSFMFLTHAYDVGNRDPPDTEALTEMLAVHCPGLQRLSITFSLHHNGNHPTADGTSLLSQGRWKDLHTFSLAGMHATAPAASAFFNFHTNLKRIDVTGLSIVAGEFVLPDSSTFSGSFLMLHPGSLPNLKSIAATAEILPSMLFCADTDPSRRPLEHISGPALVHVLMTLRPCAPCVTLKRLEVNAFFEMAELKELADLAPNLERLHLGATAFRRRYIIEPDWPKILSNFQNLKRLEGLQIIVGNRSRAENTSLIEDLVRACPTLRVLNWFPDRDEMSDEYVVIEKDEKSGRITWGLRVEQTSR